MVLAAVPQLCGGQTEGSCAEPFFAASVSRGVVGSERSFDKRPADVPGSIVYSGRNPFRWIVCGHRLSAPGATEVNASLIINHAAAVCPSVGSP